MKIGILGNGSIGCATAIYLAEAGHNVTLFGNKLREGSASKAAGAMLNVFGLDLPTNLTAIQEQQYNQLWHGIVSLGLMIIIIAHIYIGSVGMEGAIDAMNSGKVDRNWAKEHHNLWVKDEDEKNKKPEPAE